MHQLIYASEQHQAKTLTIKDDLKLFLSDSVYVKYFRLSDQQKVCFQIKNNDGNFFIDSSYFIGVDWIVKDKAAIYIEPKLNDEFEINFLSMLMESLEESENFSHLDELFDVDYDATWISIPQNKDLLSPILIVQFLKLLRHIVKKGLKKSYYTIKANLNSKVKGKILISNQIKQNLLKNRVTYTICEFQEFGFNFEENQYLKTVFSFVKAYVLQSNSYFSDSQKQHLITIISYCEPVFNLIDELPNKHQDIKVRRNVFFKDYEEAIRIGGFILKRFSYNISKISEATTKTPPFWIDMSKLFELYVFKKLKSVFPEPNTITYHDGFKGGKETDILIRVKDFEAVVDCKYKPQYKNHSPSLEDKRQLAGYTRLKSVYTKLNKPSNEVVKGIIIYSHQSCQEKIDKDDLFRYPINEYVDFYQLGIRLPEIA